MGRSDGARAPFLRLKITCPRRALSIPEAAGDCLGIACSDFAFLIFDSASRIVGALNCGLKLPKSLANSGVLGFFLLVSWSNWSWERILTLLHRRSGVNSRFNQTVSSASPTSTCSASLFGLVLTTPRPTASKNERVGAILDMMATPPRTAAARKLLSRKHKIPSAITHASRIGREAIQMQNQIQPAICAEPKNGSAIENPPASIAAQPPTKQGNRPRDLDAIMSAPAMIERVAENVIISLATAAIC